jgi:hypothetical protein
VLALVALVCPFVAGACAHPKASTAPTVVEVPLDVPAPPPRAVEPLTADTLPVVGPISEPARNAPPRTTRPAPAPAAGQTPPRAEPRADVPRVEAPPADARPADDANAAKPAPAAPTLQTTPPQNEREFEGRVRAQLSKANTDLSHVDYGKLSPPAKTQYEFAKRYMNQSEEAIRARNLVLAQTLADKAADIAAQLAGR